MKVDYDGSVLVEFAARLYSQAKTIVVSYTIGGGLLGAIIGGGGALALSREYQALMWAIVVGLVCAAIGYSKGREKAFAFRLQAQTALCQAQIEVNTRTAR